MGIYNIFIMGCVLNYAYANVWFVSLSKLFIFFLKGFKKGVFDNLGGDYSSFFVINPRFSFSVIFLLYYSHSFLEVLRLFCSLYQICILAFVCWEGKKETLYSQNLVFQGNSLISFLSFRRNLLVIEFMS